MSMNWTKPPRAAWSGEKKKQRWLRVKSEKNMSSCENVWEWPDGGSVASSARKSCTLQHQSFPKDTKPLFFVCDLIHLKGFKSKVIYCRELFAHGNTVCVCVCLYLQAISCCFHINRNSETPQKWFGFILKGLPECEWAVSYSKSHLLFIHLENLVKLTTRVFLAQFLTWFGHITFNEQQKKNWPQVLSVKVWTEAMTEDECGFRTWKWKKTLSLSSDSSSMCLFGLKKNKKINP